MRKDLTVLVVDDEPVIRDAMKHLLEHCGCEVDAVDSGSAAMARLEQRPFDLLITDFSMPGMSGDQLVTRVRKLFPNQRIIMATGYVDEYKVFGEPTALVNGLLYKPFSFSQLLDAIDNVLEQSKNGAMPSPPTPGETVIANESRLAPAPKP